jgi:hypothetical protein
VNLERGTALLEDVAKWQLRASNGNGAICRLVYASPSDVAVQVPLDCYDHLELGPLAKIATKHRAKLYIVPDPLQLEIQ